MRAHYKAMRRPQGVVVQRGLAHWRAVRRRASQLVRQWLPPARAGWPGAAAASDGDDDHPYGDAIDAERLRALAVGAVVTDAGVVAGYALADLLARAEAQQAGHRGTTAADLPPRDSDADLAGAHDEHRPYAAERWRYRG